MSDWIRYPLLALCLVAVVVVLRGQRRRSWAVSRPVRERPGRTRSRVRRVMAVSVVGWLVVAVGVAGTTAGGLLWFLGWPRLPSAAQFDVSQLLDLLKIALSVVAGFGGVVLLAVNYRKQRVAEDEHDLAVQRADREVVQKFNERFGAAAEQLAHESPAVRLAGVYALAGLADDWPAQRQVCVDVLCGYLRVAEEMPQGETEVRQAILRVIRDRTTASATLSWSELDFDFTGVTFENADFARLRFDGTVLFDGAEFAGGVASFAGAEFNGVLSCHGTRFAAERTNFAGMSTMGAVEFVGAEFAGEVVDFSGGTQNGRSIDFYRCRFTGARVDFAGFGSIWGVLRFEQCEFVDLELDLSGADSWTRMTDSKLDTVVLTYTGSDEDSVPRLRNVQLAGGTTLPDPLHAEEALDVPG